MDNYVLIDEIIKGFPLGSFTPRSWPYNQDPENKEHSIEEFTDLRNVTPGMMMGQKESFQGPHTICSQHMPGKQQSPIAPSY
jgi:hypothetical protein